MLDFEIKELDNVHISQAHLLAYYNEIVNKFQNLKWTSKNEDKLNHKADNVFGWAIQSNLKDPTKPCPPYNIKYDDEVTGEFNTLTDLYFGIGKIIIDSFPNVRQTVISGHPAGTVIKPHCDSDEFVKIHIPIITNENSFFTFNDKKYNLKVGKVYLINTNLAHGTENFGDSDRVHLMFKIRKEDVEEILNNDYILDPAIIDFEVLELQNIKFDLNELINYFDTIKSEFPEYDWVLPTRNKSEDQTKYFDNFDEAEGLHGYAVQTNLKDTSGACPVYNSRLIPDDQKIKWASNKTKLYFGFAKKILEKFPYGEEMVIITHPPKVKLPMHLDNFVTIKIHFPIETNEKSFFITERNKYNLIPGKVYLVNSTILHSTDNQGDCDRTHLMFKIPIGRIKQIINKEINI